MVDDALGVGDAGVALCDGAAVPAGGEPERQTEEPSMALPAAADGNGAAAAVADQWPGFPVVVDPDPGEVVTGERRGLDGALGAPVEAEGGVARFAAVTRGDKAVPGALGHREADRTAGRGTDIVGLATVRSASESARESAYSSRGLFC